MLRQLLGGKSGPPREPPTSDEDTEKVIEASEESHKAVIEKLRQQEARLQLLDLEVGPISQRARKKKANGTTR